MTRRIVRAVLLLAAAFSSGAPTFAQKWILPAKSPQTPVACPSTICKNGSVWLAPYQLPVASFVGRFLDSSSTGDYYRSPIATIYAMRVKSLPGSDRFYLHMNASVAMYKKGSFIDRLASGEAMGVASSFPGAAGTRPYGDERILWPDAVFAAAYGQPAWVIPTNDFAPALGAIDIDDQGYVYLGYWEYGMGIIRDQEGGLVPVSQTFPDELVPKFVIAMKSSAGRYYLLASDTYSRSVLYDVTNRSAPALQPGGRVGAIFDGAKNVEQDRIALVDTSGVLKILSADALAAGSSAPLNTFTPTDGGRFYFVVSDGTNFYGVSRGPADGTSITTFTPSGGAYSASQRYALSVRSRGAVALFNPTSANYSDGYLTIGGGYGTRELRVFRVSAGAAPAEIDLKDYFRNAYADPPPWNGMTFGTAASVLGAGYNQLVSGSMMRVGNKEYLLVNAKGLGDVYEIDTSALEAPMGLTATAVSPTQVSVSWSPVSGATSYEVFRATVHGNYAPLTTTTSSAIYDAVSADTTYLYRVRAIGSAVSGFSAVDAATTVEFTDVNLPSPALIKAAHVTQLRTAVNAMRAAAGLSAASFTDTLLAGIHLKAVHITELRTAVDAARAVIGLTPASYTDPSLTLGVASKSSHVKNLREATQ